MQRALGRILRIAAVVLIGAALLREIRKPSAQRTWQGQIMGFPYDFRPPTLGRIRDRWWNPRDERVFTPDVFGVGWSINRYEVIHRLKECLA